MRTFIARLETLAAWKLIIFATLVLAPIAFGGMVAGILENQGAYDLARILGTTSFIALLLLFVRRRQYDSWSSGVHLSAIVFAAAWLAVVALRLIAPAVFEAQNVFGPGLAATVLIAPVAAAVWALMILIARRFPSRSQRDQAVAVVRSNEELKPTAAPSSLVD